MCGKAVNTYPSTTKLVPEHLMTQKICNKPVNTCFFVFILFLIKIKLNNCLIELFLKVLFQSILP